MKHGERPQLDQMAQVTENSHKGMKHGERKLQVQVLFHRQIEFPSSNEEENIFKELKSFPTIPSLGFPEVLTRTMIRFPSNFMILPVCQPVSVRTSISCFRRRLISSNLKREANLIQL